MTTLMGDAAADIVRELVLPIVFLAIGFFLMWRVRTPGETRDPGMPDRRISVIIPARNEVTRISALLTSLKAQSYSAGEIIVVDDRSEDGTAELATALGAAVLPGEPLPDGWSGKPWACWQGAQKATGDILIFLDADTWLSPDGLARLVDAQRRTGGLLTVQPYHVTRRPYEALSAFFNIVLMAGLNAFTPLGDRLPPGGAFGPCMVCTRADYVQTGGHRQGWDAVLEGFPLARAFRAGNLPVCCRAGRGTLSFRMYPNGIGELIEGWSKGFGTGAVSIRPSFLLLSIAWVFGCFEAAIGLAQSLVALPNASGHLPMALALYVLYAVQVAWMLCRIGRFPWWTAALFPAPVIFFALVMLWSLVSIHVLGRVTWKGRRVATHRRVGTPERVAAGTQPDEPPVRK